MRKKLKKLIFGIFLFFCIVCATLSLYKTEVLYASEVDNTIFIKKVSKGYTKKFCNAIGFGLSKESAMNFSFEENKQAFQKRKELNNVNKELLAEEIAISVVEECGYPINLYGEKGIIEFKNYYLSKDKESSKKQPEWK
tara:strand:- start:1024 stop:1440 length:417 start_codon:yes stop_codon:yes gene_type:complete